MGIKLCHKSLQDKPKQKLTVLCILPSIPDSTVYSRAALRACCTHASYLSVIGRIIGFCLVYKAGNRSGNLISSAALKSHQPPVRPSSASPTPGSGQETGPGRFWRRRRRREEGDICLQIKVYMNDILGRNGG